LLLEYLVLHADRIVSRKAIVEHVWEQSLESAGNIVDVYIRQLRKEFDKKYDPGLIDMRRGGLQHLNRRGPEKQRTGT
jgi:DNA-binding response OmpR family regulator